MPGQASRQNGKKGGRPPGKKTQATLEKEAALARFRERIIKSVDPLFDSQFTLARRCSYLYRIDDVKEGKEIRRKHVFVTNPEEIREALDSIEEGDFEDGYYYITTEKPENNAIRDMLDRAFGKPSQSLDIAGDITHKFTLDDAGNLIAALSKEKQQAFYALLAEAIREKEVRGGAGKTQ